MKKNHPHIHTAAAPKHCEKQHLLSILKPKRQLLRQSHLSPIENRLDSATIDKSALKHLTLVLMRCNGYGCYTRDNHIKQRRVWLLLGRVTAEGSCPCKQSACPAICGGSEVTFKPLVPSLSYREGFLAKTSPEKRKASANTRVKWKALLQRLFQ
ncbi:hypothetical protein J6590_071894 [Homalodisca vitripennis]|nr:hypothetical protein J6590_071894 [Homalodisca vitripennis]